ncbi:MAG: hypothetical protein A2W91_03425 [Bacteroidetes bacterium GWF2_38_335]|nr:MAG: hypothetical protein A2W91_03425 [Bacteroidetes bacterium GWF2_38_335]OFY77624.1 MAG: hypothetical protein A2281_01335 [Bacteroidetes bacterium RIFOXYA12_FULL_38_20]
MIFWVNIFAQDKEVMRIPLIGETAPSFIAESTEGKLNFPDDYFSKWKIIFSHPAAFTPVCSTELLELAKLQGKFKKLNTGILVLSTDGVNSHLEWQKSLETIKYQGGETVDIDFPLISDKTLEISKLYGMIHPNYSSTRDIRGVFIIDPSNKIRAMMFYPSETGRNMDEIMRTLIALQSSDDKNILTPANWDPGEDVLLESPTTEKESEKLSKNKNPDIYNLTWYLWFTKLLVSE